MTFEELIKYERGQQEEKWGEQNHKPSTWLAILTEEVGELASTCISYDTSPDKQRLTAMDMEKELIQIAAVATAMWESGKRNGWL